jgi:hypothetical protein
MSLSCGCSHEYFCFFSFPYLPLVLAAPFSAGILVQIKKGPEKLNQVMAI